MFSESVHAHAPADGQAVSRPRPRVLPATAQTGRPCDAPPASRINRQVAGIDTWNTTRKLRQTLLLTGGDRSRDGRMDASRRLDVQRRTHDALVAATDRELARNPGPMLTDASTAVIAHSHQWFADKVSDLLVAQGFEIVERTDNAADALGAIVAEQPDLVLVGDRLAMMTGAHLLAETALFSPMSVRIVQVDDDQALALLTAGVDIVLPRQVPPADVAADAARLVATTGRLAADG